MWISFSASAAKAVPGSSADSASAAATARREILDITVLREVKVKTALPGPAAAMARRRVPCSTKSPCYINELIFRVNEKIDDAGRGRRGQDCPGPLERSTLLLRAYNDP